MIEVKIKKTALDLSECVSRVTNPASGGVVTFVGNVRGHTDGREVLRLEYEVYQSMALSELNKIVKTAFAKWVINDVVVHHREGVVNVGESAVIVVVGAERRDSAFKACGYIIDTLKAIVPIWKKEVFSDGSEWVSEHP